MNGQVDRRRTFRKSQVLCLRGEKVRKEERKERRKARNHYKADSSVQKTVRSTRAGREASQMSREVWSRLRTKHFIVPLENPL